MTNYHKLEGINVNVFVIVASAYVRLNQLEVMIADVLGLTHDEAEEDCAWRSILDRAHERFFNGAAEQLMTMSQYARDFYITCREDLNCMDQAELLDLLAIYQDKGVTPT